MILGQSQIIEGRQKEKQKEILLSLNKDLADFNKMPSFTSTDLLTRVAIDRDKQRLYIWFAEDKEGKVLRKPYVNMPYRMLNFAFKDLAAIAVVENGFILSSYGTLDDIPVGTMGTITDNPNKMPVDKVNLLTLILKMDHAKHSSFQINFYNKPYIPLAKNSPEYAALLREARKCYDRLKVVMGQPKLTPELTDPLHNEQTPIQIIEAPIRTVELPRTEIPQKQMSADPVEKEIEDERPIPKQQVQEERELSYFERLVAENKRQLSEDRSKDK